MAILKIEVDTAAIGCERYYGESFEDLFNSSLQDKIVERVIGSITKEEVAQYSILVHEKVTSGVDSLFNNLLAEDVVITDGYGRKKFIGCVEDYIKKEIDERYLYPVDSKGKKLEGCTTNGENWVQWYFKTQVASLIDLAIENSLRSVKWDIEKIMENRINDFIAKTVNDTVNGKLKKVGINL